jgi:hypothetical protein
MEFIGVDIVYLLELTWDSHIYRFSSRPIILDNDSENESLSFQGTLSEIEYIESSNLFGLVIEEQAIPMELVFDSINLVKERMRGRVLDNSRGELSYVILSRETDSTKDDYQDRIILFRGRVSQPIIGDRSQPIGHVSFSLVQGVEVDDFLIEETTRQIPSENPATIGKYYPFVFGKCGSKNYSRDSSGSITIDNYFVAPAYLKENSPWVPSANLVIAGHPVLATSVRCIDGVGVESTIPITEVFDDVNRFVFCQVDLYSGGGAGFTLSTGDNAKYYVAWTGGGLPNPYGEGVLEGGLDLIRYILENGDIDVDWKSFEGYAPLLNSYKFAGYLNRPTKALEFLQSQIIPYMPCEISFGKLGMRLVVPLMYNTLYSNPTRSILENPSFYFIGSLVSELELNEIVNHVVMNYGYSAKTENYIGLQIEVNPDGTMNDSFKSTSIYSDLSFNRYGLRTRSLEVPFVYAVEVAMRIAHDLVRQKSLGVLRIQAIADMSYNDIEVGDVIDITSDIYFLNEHPCQVIKKQIINNSVQFELIFEENPIRHSRQTGD